MKKLACDIGQFHEALAVFAIGAGVYGAYAPMALKSLARELDRSRVIWPNAGQEVAALHTLAEEAERRARMWHEKFPNTKGPTPKEFVQLADGIGWDSSSCLELRFTGACWRIEIDADSYERLPAMAGALKSINVAYEFA